MMPYERNPHFLGRDKLLIDLREKLRETKPKQYNHRVAIYGMGGVGKTQIAIEYVHRHEKDYNDIYWISAADQATLLSGFQEIGEKTRCLAGRTGLSPTEVAKEVIAWLRLQENWLLIVDNLDDVSVADGLLPATENGGHTLITTRNPNAKNIPAEGVEIPLLAKDDAVDLLCIRSEITEDQMSVRSVANEIVHELGYLALAIENAAAFIRSVDLDPIEFLPIYRKSRKEILLRPSSSKHTYPHPIAATFLLSFDKVKSDPKYGKQASELLQLLAFLNPDGILIDFLRAGSAGLSDALREVVDDKFIFHEVLGQLQQFSLIAEPRGTDTIVIHRLIQAVLRDELTESEAQRYSSEVIELCRCGFPGTWDTKEARELGRRFQSQVVEPAFEVAKIASESAGITLVNIGLFLWRDGKGKDAERLFKRSYEIRQMLLGNEHPETLTSMHNLALTYRDQGKLQDAADLQERELEATKRTLGEEHPDTSTSMSNLALTYGYQGKLQDAADLQERELEATKRTLGEEHPGTLTSMNNLAWTYETLGRTTEALSLIQQCVDGSKRVLGEDHPDTSDCKVTLCRWRDKVANTENPTES